MWGLHTGSSQAERCVLSPSSSSVSSVHSSVACLPAAILTLPYRTLTSFLKSVYQLVRINASNVLKFIVLAGAVLVWRQTRVRKQGKGTRGGHSAWPVYRMTTTSFDYIFTVVFYQWMYFSECFHLSCEWTLLCMRWVVFIGRIYSIQQSDLSSTHTVTYSFFLTSMDDTTHTPH